jgi:hypothetical protein
MANAGRSKYGAVNRTPPLARLYLARGFAPLHPHCRHGGMSGLPRPDTDGEELRPIHPHLGAHEIDRSRHH